MDRRQFLVAAASTAAVAGCTGDPTAPSVSSGRADADQPVSTNSFGRFSDIQELLDSHYSTLGATTFRATERFVRTHSERDGTDTTEQTIRAGESGTLLTETDGTSNNSSDRDRTVWFTDKTRITSETHSYSPDGLTPPIIDRDAIAELDTLAVFEPVADTDTDDPVSVFEAVRIADTPERRTEFQTVDVRIEIADSGYIRSVDAEIVFQRNPGVEATATTIYEYTVSDLGIVTVSEPAFVDEALRIEGQLSEDNSAVVLEHMGGQTVAADTQLVVQDAAALPPAGVTFPTDFEPGERAYVSWISEDDAAISVGTEPKTVARAFVRSSDQSDRSVYLRDASRRDRPERWEIRFD